MPAWPLALALSLLPALLPTAAHAHQKRTVRKAVATARVAPADAEHPAERLMVEVLVWQRVAGARAALFRGRFDLDRSGRFDRAESRLAGDAGAPEAIGGLVLERDGRPQAPQSAEAKARLVDDAVEFAVMLTWDLGPVPAGQTTLGLRARADRARPDAPALVVELAALPPLLAVGGAPALRGAVAGPHPALPGGEAVRLVITRAQTVPEEIAR